MTLRDNFDNAIDHFEGGLVVNRVRWARDSGGPSLRIGHGVVRHELVIQVWKDREVDQS
jgi:hypothetical protein